ncbi:MAG TPA: tetratricopeptide repeat protein [Burkholderiales bacterium]|nr:tetratricopeptide repeat protein [Burkholderiales bacterium]
MFDLEEQEKIDAIKRFWKQYGHAIIAGAVVLVIGFGGMQGWNHYQRMQIEHASILFSSLEDAVRKNDVIEIRNVGAQVIERYGRTAYGPMAALIMAKTNHENDDLDSAAAQLRWAVDRARDEDVKLLARLRLAGVLLDKGEHAEALQLLNVTTTDAYVAVFADMRGDLLVAEGRLDEARAAYRQALEKVSEQSQWRNVVQIKLDALGNPQ